MPYARLEIYKTFLAADARHSHPRATADFHSSATAARHASELEPTFRVEAAVDRPITECALLNRSEKQWVSRLDFGEHSRFAANQRPIQEMNIQFTMTPSKVQTPDPHSKAN
jgi:hypothetical protein